MAASILELLQKIIIVLFFVLVLFYITLMVGLNNWWIALSWVWVEEGLLHGERVHSGYGREKDTSVTEINGNGNKTMKTNQISNKAKQGQAILKNGMRPTKKKKISVFGIEIRKRCAKHNKIRWDSHFLVYKQKNSF